MACNSPPKIRTHARIRTLSLSVLPPNRKTLPAPPAGEDEGEAISRMASTICLPFRRAHAPRRQSIRQPIDDSHVLSTTPEDAPDATNDDAAGAPDEDDDAPSSDIDSAREAAAAPAKTAPVKAASKRKRARRSTTPSEDKDIDGYGSIVTYSDYVKRDPRYNYSNAGRRARRRRCWPTIWESWGKMHHSSVEATFYAFTWRDALSLALLRTHKSIYKSKCHLLHTSPYAPVRTSIGSVQHHHPKSNQPRDCSEPICGGSQRDAGRGDQG
ncbi:hypothetical protein K440DRAFT_26000 [Wilcoxina mikolae CBS 423.85]|nr:hypothetical protein K440DRAFT_26000 [Wilcoxina mikolae CBS 423.85]